MDPVGDVPVEEYFGLQRVGILWGSVTSQSSLKTLTPAERENEKGRSPHECYCMTSHVQVCNAQLYWGVDSYCRDRSCPSRGQEGRYNELDKEQCLALLVALVTRSTATSDSATLAAHSNKWCVIKSCMLNHAMQNLCNLPLSFSLLLAFLSSCSGKCFDTVLAFSISHSFPVCYIL